LSSRRHLHGFRRFFVFFLVVVRLLGGLLEGVVVVLTTELGWLLARCWGGFCRAVVGWGVVAGGSSFTGQYNCVIVVKSFKRGYCDLP
jgi:hypothetical protein